MTGWLRFARICCSAALFLAVFSNAAALRAEPADAACPDRSAVLRALRALSAKDVRDAPGPVDEHPDLRTEDNGDEYRVSVNGRTRSYTDPRRECAERAQVAAVFAALVLSSPNAVDAEPEPAPVPVRAAPAPPAAPANASAEPVTAYRPRHWWLDAGIALAFAPGSAGTPMQPGLELGVAYVRAHVGAALELRLPATSARVPVGSTTARLLRYPLAASARWLLFAPPFGGTLDAGPTLALLRVRSAVESGGASQSRLELGFQLATHWQLAKPAISPYFELFSEVIPVRYSLALEPTGVLAKTPGLWLGAVLGVSAHFD